MLKPISIGCHKITHPVFLAPMSGVTDLPFRQIAARSGAGLVFTEMVACKSLLCGNDAMRLRLEGQKVGLHAVQLAGREPHWMAEGARMAEANGADILDINFGCPARKVTSGYSGSALMREPDRALRLIEATVKATNLPVCVKMRLGWDETLINAPSIAKSAENAGARLITVHGRTRCQFYKGKANWRAIADVVESVTIPVIANGDLAALAEAPDMLAQSRAAGVMISRGAYGRPWFPGFVASHMSAHSTPKPLPTLTEKKQIVTSHYDAILTHYGIAQGIRIARKHLNWYLNDIQCTDKMVRQQAMTSFEPKTVLAAINVAFDRAMHDTEAKPALCEAA